MTAACPGLLVVEEEPAHPDQGIGPNRAGGRVSSASSVAARRRAAATVAPPSASKEASST